MLDDDQQVDEIERALEMLPPRAGAFEVVTALRKVLAPELARQAAELFDLRRRASARFPSGRLRSLTRRGLEQATREFVARERARRIASIAPNSSVHDVTCGLGSDALELSLAGLRVLASDRDIELVRCARRNLSNSPNPHCAFVADAEFVPSRGCFLIVDPDRRPGEAAASERSLDPRSWSPAPAVLARALDTALGACVKLPAGFDIGRCPTSWIEQRAHSWQWVSAGGELCEVNLWLGALASPSEATAVREVVSISATGLGRRWSARPDAVVSLSPKEVSEIRWLSDPDPGVVRSGLLGALAAELGMAPLGAQCAYLGGAACPQSPLVRSWRVIESCAADSRAVRSMLTRHDVGAIQVLKRGHPQPSDELERKFRGRGANRGVVVVARLDEGHQAFLVAPGRVGDEGFEPPTSSL